MNIDRSIKNVDWVTVRSQYEAGTPVSKLAIAHKISAARIYQVKRRDSWTPATKGLKDSIVRAASVHNGEATSAKAPKGKAIRAELGPENKDRELLSDFQALTTGRAGAVLDQAAVELALMKQHRSTISRASLVAENILVRLHALVVDGKAADVITFQTKAGRAYHRVPFLGDRESVSDALLKCANAISKLVPLERQAHGLADRAKETTMPTVTFNMPNVRVISVDGKGKVIRTEDQPALIEGHATSIGNEKDEEHGSEARTAAN